MEFSQLNKLLQKLKSYDEATRQRAVLEIEVMGASAFDAVCGLLEHEVAKWEAIALLPQLAPERAIPYLLNIVNFEKARSVREKEHAKKYFRIRAIQELGKMGRSASHELLAIFAREGVEKALAYFIDPEHPHLHQEVIVAVQEALREIATPTAHHALKQYDDFAKNHHS